MAGTDDIAEKVADILLDQIAKNTNMLTEVVPKVFKGVGSVTSVTLGQVIDEVKKNHALKKLMGLEGEVTMAEITDIARRFCEKASTIHVGDADHKDFDVLLKDQKVLYAKVDKSDDNCKLYFFLNKDKEKVENATRILQAQRGAVTELNAKLYFNSLSPDHVHVVEGLSSVETELFRHYARQQGLLFTTVSKKDGDMIVCSTEDAKKAQRALLYTGWALTGANGARVREQVEYRLTGRSQINLGAEDAEKEFYIVSQTNASHYVHISADDFELYKRGKQVSTVSREDPDFVAKCIASCEALHHPVVMTAEQYHAGFTQDQLQQANTIDLFPEVHDDEIEMDQVNRLANLVMLKSGLDNDHNATWGLWDPSVSYSEFAAYENIMDEDEREAREYEFEHFKQAAYYSNNNHTTYDVNMKEKNLDFLITQAEEKRREQNKQSMHQEQSYSQWAFGGTRGEDSAERK